MTELTKRRALEICRDLWLWLEENPGKRKGDWPGWKNIDIGDDCPCCAYVREQPPIKDGIMDCLKCPLLSLWPAKRVGYRVMVPCERPTSPYWKWWDRDAPVNRNKTYYARKIRVAAEQELAKLDAEGDSHD